MEMGGTNYPWSVTLSVRRGKNKKTTELGAVPTGSWYISNLHLADGILCEAMPICSVALSGFQMTIVQGRQSFFLHTVESVRTIDNVDLSEQKASI